MNCASDASWLKFLIAGLLGVVIVVAFFAILWFLADLYAWLDQFRRPVCTGVVTVRGVEPLRADRVTVMDTPSFSDREALFVGSRLTLQWEDGKTVLVDDLTDRSWSPGDRVRCRYVDGRSGKRWTWVLGLEQEAA